ncbi:hypothetical protein ACFV4N_17580 [Actinosynnema sp. NPDC059797]
MKWVVAVALTLAVWVGLGVVLAFLVGMLGSLGPVELFLVAAVALVASVAINRKRLAEAWR